jgi:hypothetical protein
MSESPDTIAPHVARVLLHTAHLATFVVLVATGLLLLVPTLRAAVTGGYSLIIREVHSWGGVAFLVLPAVIVACAGARSVFGPPADRTLRGLWQGLHLGVTVAMGGALTLTGFALWSKRLVPEPITEVSRTLHDWLTYGAIVLLAAHLGEVGVAAVVARIAAGTTATARHLRR